LKPKQGADKLKESSIKIAKQYCAAIPVKKESKEEI
jgi:hypothetical protein